MKCLAFTPFWTSGCAASGWPPCQAKRMECNSLREVHSIRFANIPLPLGSPSVHRVSVPHVVNYFAHSIWCTFHPSHFVHRRYIVKMQIKSISPHVSLKAQLLCKPHLMPLGCAMHVVQSKTFAVTPASSCTCTVGAGTLHVQAHWQVSPHTLHRRCISLFHS